MAEETGKPRGPSPAVARYRKAAEDAEEKGRKAAAKARELQAVFVQYVASEDAAHDVDELVTLGGAGLAAILDAEDIGEVEIGQRADGSVMTLPGSLAIGVGVNIAARVALGKVSESRAARMVRKAGVGMAAGGVYALVGREYINMKAAK